MSQGLESTTSGAKLRHSLTRTVATTPMQEVSTLLQPAALARFLID
jgi:hypothetical protein